MVGVMVIVMTEVEEMPGAAADGRDGAGAAGAVGDMDIGVAPGGDAAGLEAATDGETAGAGVAKMFFAVSWDTIPA